jgi:3-dehydroquinate dehydratase II
VTGGRIEVMHGVNLDVLDRRDPRHYAGLGLAELEARIEGFAAEMGLRASFSQTNHEGEFCESLHSAAERADGLVLNPGAWTHYSWAIRDALEVAGVPAVEVHLSAISDREDWRRRSVIRDVCVGSVEGRGVDGYRDALELLKQRLAA